MLNSVHSWEAPRGAKAALQICGYWGEDCGTAGRSPGPAGRGAARSAPPAGLQPRAHPSTPAPLYPCTRRGPACAPPEPWTHDPARAIPREPPASAQMGSAHAPAAGKSRSDSSSHVTAPLSYPGASPPLRRAGAVGMRSAANVTGRAPVGRAVRERLAPARICRFSSLRSPALRRRAGGRERCAEGVGLEMNGREECTSVARGVCGGGGGVGGVEVGGGG